MILRSKTNYKPGKGEKMDSKSKTQQTGYVPTKIRVTEMILAGKRLAAARQEQYDKYLDGTEEINVPLTRKRGIDMSEIIDEGRNVSKRLQTAKKAQFEAEKKLAEDQLKAKLTAEINAEIEKQVKPL